MKNRFILLVFVFIATSFQYAKCQLITVEGYIDSLHFCLNKPSNQAQTLCIIVPGSGPTDINGNSIIGVNTNCYKMLDSALTSNGLSVLRYDKRGVGKSQKVKEQNLTFDVYIKDLIQLHDSIKRKYLFTQIYLIGHSEGGLIATIVAKQIPVNGLILLAATSESADTLILNQLKAQSPYLHEKSIPLMADLKKGNIIPNPPTELLSIFRASAQPYMISWIKYHPLVELKSVTCKTLILQGDSDMQIEPKQGKKLAGVNPNFQYVLIKDMNHVLKICKKGEANKNRESYVNPIFPIHKKMVNSIVKFCK